MFVAIVLSTILFAAAGPEAASPPPAKAPGGPVSEAVVTAKAKDDSMKLVCRSEAPVGSRLPVKRCETKEDAEMRKFEDRQMIEKAQGDIFRH